MIQNQSDITAERKSALLWGGLSFFLPSAVMLVILAVCGIAPFGDGTLITESGAAWFESLLRMYDSLASGEGVFYHLNVGFGSSFYSAFAAGLCSPFLFLALFFSSAHLAAAYSLMTVLRTGMAGLSCWLMLDKCAGLNRHGSFALACGYSLCGFTACAAYYPSMADAALFFPLLVLGVFCYVYEGRPIRLFLFGAMFFLTSARLVVIGLTVSVVFYFVFYLRRGHAKLKYYRFAMFAATLLCAAMTAAVLLLPMLASAVYYGDGLFSPVEESDLLASLCFGGYGTSTAAGGFGMCVAGLLLMGLFSFLFNERVGLREKLAVSAGVVIVLLCSAVPVLDDVMLGFYSYHGEKMNLGFMLAVLAVYGTARNFAEYEGIPHWSAPASAGIYALLAVVSVIFRGSDVFAVLAEAGLAIFGTAVFVMLSISGKRPTLRLSCMTAAVLVIFGVIRCGSGVMNIHSAYRYSDLKQTAEIRLESRGKRESLYEEGVPRFYRVRSTDGVSDSVDLKHNEIAGLTRFAEKLGIKRDSDLAGADNFTPFTDIIFGIGVRDYGADAYVPDCSPAYLIGSWDEGADLAGNAFEVQNRLAEKWFGVKGLFEVTAPEPASQEVSSESDRYLWTFGNDTTAVEKYVIALGGGESLYMLAEGGEYRFAVNGDSRSEWRRGCDGGVYLLDESYAGKDGTRQVTVYLSADVNRGVPKPSFAVVTSHRIKALNKAARSRGGEYISRRGSTIKFMLKASKEQTAFTSIPYEYGWEIRINGRKVSPVEICGGLIGIEVSQGDNSVVMKYTPPFFKMGLILSAVMFLLGAYIAVYTEHDLARRRKVRMAFRAVELRNSREAEEERQKAEQAARQAEAERQRAEEEARQAEAREAARREKVKEATRQALTQEAVRKALEEAEKASASQNTPSEPQLQSAIPKVSDGHPDDSSEQERTIPADSPTFRRYRKNGDVSEESEWLSAQPSEADTEQATTDNSNI